MKLQESGENYLENIYILQKRIGNVHSVDLAREMDFSKPSVSRAIHLLEDHHYLTIEEDGTLHLTESGLEVAKKIYERHVFLSEYLMAIGVPEDIAVEDACRMEHVISETSFSLMKEHIFHCFNECPKARDDSFFNFNRQALREIESES